MATYCNAFKMETDENKFGFAQNPDSFESWQGRRGPYYTPVVSVDGTLSWVNNGGLPNPQPVNIAGPPGQGLEIQGVVETVQQLPTGAAEGDVWLVGTDSPYEAYIWASGGWLDLGQVAVGPQGPAGEPGTDGISPEVTVTEISGGHRVTITDAGGTEAFDVLDGEDGAPGATGPQGPAGETGPAGPTGPAGQDGAAATISVGTVSGLPAGSTPTITNSGSSSAAVFNFGIPAGADGATGPTGPAGPGVPSGGTAGQVLAKTSGTDYATGWIDPPSGGDEWVLLWKNASPLSNFPAQTLSVNYSAYSRLIVFYNLTVSNMRQLMTGVDVTTTGGVLMRTTTGSGEAYVDTRSFNFSGGSQIVFFDAYDCAIYANSTAFQTANNSCVPYAIYGVKQ